MSVAIIPCEKNPDLEKKIEAFAEVIRTQAHQLAGHGLSEKDFYGSGILEGAIQRIRGQYSAQMSTKRQFVSLVLNYMQDAAAIKDWQSAGGSNRFDYSVTLLDDRICAIELKGCLDGNNTNIFERPAHVQEFVMWSVCSNAAADPRHNVWSGIHTRLSAEIIEHQKQVDGLIVWDWICGTIGRPCPKLKRAEGRTVTVGQYQLTPPCIYLFPRTVPSVRNNPNPEPHTLDQVGFLAALNRVFGGYDDELNKTRFLAANKGSDIVRTTTIERGGVVQHTSRPTPIRRK
jgi:hypothetical protein